jgi:hypothetical protein
MLCGVRASPNVMWGSTEHSQQRRLLFSNIINSHMISFASVEHVTDLEFVDRPSTFVCLFVCLLRSTYMSTVHHAPILTCSSVLHDHDPQASLPCLVSSFAVSHSISQKRRAKTQATKRKLRQPPRRSSMKGSRLGATSDLLHLRLQQGCERARALLGLKLLVMSGPSGKTCRPNFCFF